MIDRAMENHADRVSSTRPAMESANMKTNHAFKPGRKFGLTGQRQQQQVNSFATAADGRRMSAHREEQRNNWMYSLSEQEMEDRYNAICLAIRTENMTLGQRLEHQHAERDLVENNLNQEVRVLHSLFLSLKQEVARSQTSPYRESWTSGGWNEMFIKAANQLDAVHSSATRISSSAESLGAVEYEARLSAAVQVLILYVDHIKRKWEKEHHELEETKRILKESGVNVAQCLSTLPDRSAPSNPSGPVSKRRASFPAAPLRRISLKPPPLVVGSVSNLMESSVHISDPVSSITIAEEREDGLDADHPAASIKNHQSESADGEQTAVAPISPLPTALVHISSTATTPTSVASGDHKATAAADVVPVTIRRRGVAGVKSHSWSSSHMTSVLPDRRDSSADHGASTSHRGTALFKPTLWISKAGQWTHLQTGRWHKTIASYRSIYSEHWATLRQKRLQLLRYSASACFLLAALISLIVTFVPSSSSGSSSSAANGSSTVMPPPGRTDR